MRDQRLLDCGHNARIIIYQEDALFGMTHDITVLSNISCGDAYTANSCSSDASRSIGFAGGRAIKKIDPPSLSSTQICPPCASIMPRQIAVPFRSPGYAPVD